PRKAGSAPLRCWARGRDDMVPRPRNGLSLCAGGGGLDMGVMLAEPDFHSRCFVEWAEYPRSVLVDAQAAGYFPPAPIWDDVTTFDGRPFCGAFDTILAGYPCQPFSQAGQRRGENDPRHLWPHVARIIREVGPRWVFLENVAGHVSLGAETVLRELQQMGFQTAAGIFSAEEVGASQERQRWFCVAYSDDTSWLAQPQGGERDQRGRAVDCGKDVGSASSARCEPTRCRSDTIKRSGKSMSREGCSELANAKSNDGRCEQQAKRARGGRAGSSGSDAELANADGRDAGTERQQQSGQQRFLTEGGRSRGYRNPGLFPPKPSDIDQWAAVLGAYPDLAPAVARCDLATACKRIASLFTAKQARTIERRTRGLSGADFLRSLEEEAAHVVGASEAIADFRRLADGMARRSRIIELLGNGVVPLCAGHAWRSLASAHGLRPLDLAAAYSEASAATDDHGRMRCEG
ncbi:MAG: DNA cytosine methyltransferase, partial [Pseudomonadota bacterium]